MTPNGAIPLTAVEQHVNLEINSNYYTGQRVTMALFGRKTAEEREADKIAKQEARTTKKDARQADTERNHANKKAISEHLHGSTKMGSAIILVHAADLVREGEEVLFAAGGEEDGSDSKAILVATDQRIIVSTSKKMTFGQIELPYAKIDRIDVGRTWRGAWVTLFAGSQETRIEKAVEDLEPLKDIVRERQAATDTASTPTAPAVSSAEEVKKLAELHAQGILSDDEFAAAKAKALGL